MATKEQRDAIIYPLVPESVQHNARVMSQIRALTASLFGAVAGIIGLESLHGFIFYILSALFVTQLIIQLRTGGRVKSYFHNSWSELWSKDVLSGMMSFVLTWTLFYGIVRS